MIRRTKIIIEQRQRTTVRRGHGPVKGWCEECSSEVLMLSPDEAASVMQTSTRMIFRQIEAGAVHFKEGGDGTLRICMTSLTGHAE